MRDRDERIGHLFDRALAAPPAERQSIVELSSEPDDIKAEVRALLADYEFAGDFLETPAETMPVIREGTCIGQYRVGSMIGRGGMGIVYEAEDTRLGRRVALKSLSPELSSDARLRERLRKEARAAAALTHPGIATVYALEEYDGQLFIISEYLDGENLRAEIDRGRLSLDKALAASLEIARALAAAHERGIVHRDLKPENVVRTTSGALKILDFGLAQFADRAVDLLTDSQAAKPTTRLTQTGFIAGTPPYMAPEQLLGRGTDFRADQFAFGVLLYELCTGRHPFQSDSIASVIAQILAAPPRPPQPDDHVPDEVWRVIDRCLEKDPAGRFESTNNLVSALEDVQSGAATTTPNSAPTPALRTPDSAPALRTPHSAPALRPPDTALRTPLSWWRFHQLAAALAYWSMVWPAWYVHRSFGRWGLFFFFALLAAVVVAGNLRLHLWFSSRVYPEDLPSQRIDVARWIRGADIAFATLLIIGGIALPEDRAGWAAVLISFGIGSALAFLFIEPATARAAFRPSRETT
jgi:serine/threonine protein kinase